MVKRPTTFANVVSVAQARTRREAQAEYAKKRSEDIKNDDTRHAAAQAIRQESERVRGIARREKLKAAKMEKAAAYVAAKPVFTFTLSFEPIITKYEDDVVQVELAFPGADSLITFAQITPECGLEWGNDASYFRHPVLLRFYAELKAYIAEKMS